MVLYLVKLVDLDRETRLPTDDDDTPERRMTSMDLRTLSCGYDFRTSTSGPLTAPPNRFKIPPLCKSGLYFF